MPITDEEEEEDEMLARRLLIFNANFGDSSSSSSSSSSPLPFYFCPPIWLFVRPRFVLSLSLFDLIYRSSII